MEETDNKNEPADTVLRRKPYAREATLEPAEPAEPADPFRPNLEPTDPSLQDFATKAFPEGYNVEPLAPGDVVRLKTGGPEMTVELVGPDERSENIQVVQCIWFAGDVLREFTFRVETLEYVR